MRIALELFCPQISQNSLSKPAAEIVSLKQRITTLEEEARSAVREAERVRRDRVRLDEEATLQSEVTGFRNHKLLAAKIFKNSSTQSFQNFDLCLRFSINMYGSQRIRAIETEAAARVAELTRERDAALRTAELEKQLIAKKARRICSAVLNLLFLNDC